MRAVSSHEGTCRCNISLGHVPTTFSCVCKRDFVPATCPCHTSLLHVALVCTTQVFCLCNMSLQHVPSCLPTLRLGRGKMLMAAVHSIFTCIVVLYCVMWLSGGCKGGSPTILTRWSKGNTHNRKNGVKYWERYFTESYYHNKHIKITKCSYLQCNIVKINSERFVGNICRWAF